MDATKPYEFIGFGAMDATKPYEFIGFGARGWQKKLPTPGGSSKGAGSYKFIRFGDIHGPRTI